MVLLYHDWLPADYRQKAPEQAYMSEWHHNMTVALAPAMASPDHGAFNPACFIHTGFTPTLKIGGLNYLQAFANFYRRSGPYHLQDTCGLECNPTCP